MDFEEKTPVKGFLIPLAQTIKHHRKLKKWTQADLSREIGVSRVSVAMYELGRLQPSFPKLCQLSLKLEFSLDEVMNASKDLME